MWSVGVDILTIVFQLTVLSCIVKSTLNIAVLTNETWVSIFFFITLLCNNWNSILPVRKWCPLAEQAYSQM